MQQNPSVAARLPAQLARVLQRRAGRPVAVLLCIAVSFSLWLNLPEQKTDYGTQYGTYADQVDSFSEYIIRNSVIHSWNTDRFYYPHLWLTRGYFVPVEPGEPMDFEYDPVDIRPYLSNRGLQTVAYSAVVSILGESFETRRDAVFQAFRFVNSLLVSVAIFIFFMTLFRSSLWGLTLAVLFAHLPGIVLYSSNLYFQIWAMLLPLAAYPLLHWRGGHWPYVAAAYFGSIAYFMMRYEFATTFAILWLLPVLLYGLGRGRGMFRTGVSSFVAVCAGFATALALHLLMLSLSPDFDIEWVRNAMAERARMRMASLDGVPTPFSSIFFYLMSERWSWAGFEIPGLVRIEKNVFLFVFVASWVAAFLYPRFRPSSWILLWALVCYLSWYVFGYQHIMHHNLYDSLLFVLTIQLSLFIVWGKAASRLFESAAADPGKPGSVQGSPSSSASASCPPCRAVGL